MDNASPVMDSDDFRTLLTQAVTQLGGGCNMHAHLDRARTLSRRYLAHFGMPPRDAPRAPLQVKQGLVGELHNGPAYTQDDLRSRMRASIDASIAHGVVRLVTCVDATPDIDHRAIDVALGLKAEYRERILLEIVPHPIFGFKEDERFEKSRWDVFRDACKKCDGVGSLPERDVREDSVGHTEHLRRTLLLGRELGKPTYVHVGQANDPQERDIFELIDAVKWLDFRAGPYDEPLVWAIHNISSAGFSESDFARVLEGHKEQRIGLICCPRAAVSMRQNRARTAPLHNSIARVLEMALAGITIRLGTDNIGDLFVPTTTEDVLDQAIVLADALRFYDVAVLAKFIAGKRLNDNDKEVIRQYLVEDLRAYRRVDPEYEFCLPL
jgi:cytosine/creatinine deaminase